MGNLDKVWTAVPDGVAEQEHREAFESFFGAPWSAILDAADQSYAYNAANNVYFAVRDLLPVDNLSVEQFLREQGRGRIPNIIAS